MDVLELVKFAGAGSAGAAIAVTFLFVKGYVVPGYIYQAEVQAREKAEERIRQSIPVLKDANLALERGVGLAREATAAAAEAMKHRNGGRA